MESSKIIGGEFEIDVQKQDPLESCFDKSVFAYSSGRSALFYILTDAKERLQVDTVLLPNYLCSSIVRTAQSAGLNVVFYELNNELEIDCVKFSQLYRSNCAVLLINYFGLKCLDSQITYVRSLNDSAVIIEDDVQAFWEFDKNLGAVDYKFTSLRKTFALPDGGFVKSKYCMKKVDELNTFYQYKLAGSVLKMLRQPNFYGDQLYLEMFEKGESLIDEDISKGMSVFSKERYSQVDFGKIQKTRKRNASVILDGLRSLGVETLLPVDGDKTPLCIPVYLNNRNNVRKYLFQHNVFFPVHWPLDGMNLNKGAELADKELSIVIDQRYLETDMTYILNLLGDALK